MNRPYVYKVQNSDSLKWTTVPGKGYVSFLVDGFVATILGNVLGL